MKRLDTEEVLKVVPGRRQIIAAAARRTQAIQERKIREQQEEQETLELKKRRERLSKSRQRTKLQLEVPQTNADNPKVQKQSEQANSPKCVSRSKTTLATCEEQKQIETIEEITREIEGFKTNKQRTSICLQSTDCTQKLLPKKSNDIDQLTKREISQNDKLVKQFEDKEQQTDNPAENERQLNKVTKDKKQQTDEQAPLTPAWGYAKKCDSRGRPDCSTPCASSSESEDERFYRHMVGRYRATRYSIVEYINSGAYSDANVHNNEPKPTKFKKK